MLRQPPEGLLRCGRESFPWRGISRFLQTLKIFGLIAVCAGLFASVPAGLYAETEAVFELEEPVSGRTVSMETITSADVLARVELLRAELELIRFEMGRSKPRRSEITVTRVAPREVAFQAFTMFRKANFLQFEITGTLGTELQVEVPRDIRPLHVWRIVNEALARVLSVKRKLGIRERSEEAEKRDSARPVRRVPRHHPGQPAVRPVVQAADLRQRYVPASDPGHSLHEPPAPAVSGDRNETRATGLRTRQAGGGCL